MNISARYTIKCFIGAFAILAGVVLLQGLEQKLEARWAQDADRAGIVQAGVGR